MALPLSAAAAPLPVFVVDFLLAASSFARADPLLPFVVGALVVPFVVTDDDDEDGDGRDDGDAAPNAFSLLICNLCSPFCKDNAVGILTAFSQTFEQYRFFLSFPFPSADLPH